LKTGFCERNLKPVFALLVVLIAATIVWAIAARQEKPVRAGETSPAAAPGKTVKQTPGQGQGRGSSALPIDASTMATPNGGIKMIVQPGTGSPSVGLGTGAGPARMELLGAGLRNRHTFNTVSSLILPSVVSIHATRNQLASRPFGAGGGVRFAEPFDGVPEKFVRNRAYESVGSGFIIDSRGYVLTNHHVISQTVDLLVSVSGKVKGDFPATVIAVDPTADLALIKISGAQALSEARLGDSHTVQAGDWVLAFGSPFGLEQTVTQGIISSKRESLVVEGISYGDMLQTDAPINRGSSGGPLCNLTAEVIGINTAIYGPGTVFSGTGFAIPVDRAKAFLARCSQVFNR
jgi:serine protease Do